MTGASLDPSHVGIAEARAREATLAPKKLDAVTPRPGCLGFKVWGFGFRVWGLGLRVLGSSEFVIYSQGVQRPG